MESNITIRLFSFFDMLVVGSLLFVGCARTIEELIDKRDVPLLIKALDNKNEEVQASAATALGDFGYDAAAGPLIKSLEDKSENVRLKAEAALVKLEDYAIDQLLVTMGNGTSVSPAAKKNSKKSL